jgi:hypothetical protein
MQKQTVPAFNPNPFGESALAVSRNFWLAGLGATVVTRDWVQSEGNRMFRTLVREGTVVESRAIRFVGDQVETSVTRANAAWKRTRRTVESTVKKAATTVVDLAQQVLPKSLPAIELPKAFAPAAKTKRTRKAGAARKARPVKKGKRTKRA